MVVAHVGDIPEVGKKRGKNYESDIPPLFKTSKARTSITVNFVRAYGKEGN